VVMTLEADYAVRIVDTLARAGRRVDAKNLAAQTGVPLRFALKILRKLVSGGLIVSFKGARGGYALARGADRITLRQVIESVEGPYMLSRCQQTAYCCSNTAPGCRFQGIYDEISALVRKKLDSYTFAVLKDGDAADRTDAAKQDT